MLKEGYGERRFADLEVRTDRGSADDALARLLARLEQSGFIAAAAGDAPLGVPRSA